MLLPWGPQKAVCAWSNAFRLFASRPLQSLPSASGCWQVSSHGRCCNTRGVVSFGSPHPSGYRYVFIARRTWPVHRIVKLMFHGLPPTQDAWQVHHQDGSRANNRLDNLAYVTPSQNASYSHKSQLRQDSGPKRSKPVLWRAVGSQSWTLCPSTSFAAKQLGMSQGTVSKCCHANSSCKGIEFQFQKLDMDIGGEEWRAMRDPRSGKEVPGRMVSSLGRVTTRSGLVHYGCMNQTGYCETVLRMNSAQRTEQVHRLVVVSFHGPPPTPEHTCVNHKDGNKSNNALENLEWATHAENISHYFANAVVSRKGKGCRPVWSRLHGSHDAWLWHPSITSCANTLGTYGSSISSCLGGSAKQAAGYEFRGAESEESLLPGEEWREIDMEFLLRDKALRE